MTDGNAGNHSLQDILGAGLAGLATGGDKLLNWANSGGWAINEDGGRPYLNAIDDFVDDLTEIETELPFLARAPEMGSGPYAQRVAQHFVTVFNGDERALIPVITQAKANLVKAREAFQIAIHKYNEADSENDQKFKPYYADGIL